MDCILSTVCESMSMRPTGTQVDPKAARRKRHCQCALRPSTVHRPQVTSVHLQKITKSTRHLIPHRQPRTRARTREANAKCLERCLERCQDGRSNIKQARGKGKKEAIPGIRYFAFVPEEDFASPRLSSPRLVVAKDVHWQPCSWTWCLRVSRSVDPTTSCQHA